MDVLCNNSIDSKDVLQILINFVQKSFILSFIL